MSIIWEQGFEVAHGLSVYLRDLIFVPKTYERADDPEFNGPARPEVSAVQVVSCASRYCEEATHGWRWYKTSRR